MMCPYRLLYAPLAAFQRPRDRLGVCERLRPREALMVLRAGSGDRVLVKF